MKKIPVAQRPQGFSIYNNLIILLLLSNTHEFGMYAFAFLVEY